MGDVIVADRFAELDTDGDDLAAVINALARVVDDLIGRVESIEDYLGIEPDEPPHLHVVDVPGPDSYADDADGE